MSEIDWIEDPDNEGNSVVELPEGGHGMQLVSVGHAGNWWGWAKFINKSLLGLEQSVKVEVKPHSEWNYWKAIFRWCAGGEERWYEVWVKRGPGGEMQFLVYRIDEGGMTLLHQEVVSFPYPADSWRIFRVQCIDYALPNRIKFTLDYFGSGIWQPLTAWLQMDPFLWGTSGGIGFGMECHGEGLGLTVDNVLVEILGD